MTSQLDATVQFAFDNTFARLPDRFFVRLAPTPVTAPRLIKLNEDLARRLGLDARALASADGVAVLAGNRVPDGAEPLAQAYAGHQFAHFVPQLGDGRAILLGEIVGRDGTRRDIQLKGSGPTPFSRRGDGRAALGPVLREYIVSEAFAALGIASTRALAAVTTGEAVARETMLPGAVLTRVAASHIRVGTFQYFAARRDEPGLRTLADHVIARHYPEAAAAANRYRALLDMVIARQAALVAQWMHVGFIHGVMNTDNMSIAGETIDFGPCAFMDTYDPAQVYSSIDRNGRYAYANQPAIAGWNLARFAETLIPLLADTQDAAIAQGQAALDGYSSAYHAAHLAGMRRKLGLATQRDGDKTLADELLDCMARGRADFTLTFRRLCDATGDTAGDEPVESLFTDPVEIGNWLVKWRHRLAEENCPDADRRTSMRAVNPAFIPRNHRVEEVIAAAVDAGDLTQFETLVEVLARPYEDQPEHAHYARPPSTDEIVHQTFCGT